MHACIHIGMHIHKYVYACMYVCMYVCMCVCVYMSANMHAYIYIYIYIYTHIYIDLEVMAVMAFGAKSPNPHRNSWPRPDQKQLKTEIDSGLKYAEAQLFSLVGA